MAEQVIHSGEQAELVFFNQPDMDICFVQEAHSTLKIHVLHVSLTDEPAHTQDHLTIRHVGEGCETEIYALNCLKQDDTAQLHTQMLHEKGLGKSKQLVKFVLGDNAKGEFFGEMKIVQDAQKVEALQTNRNLLLSDKATIRTRPQLEIYADDVKASHGASTGQIDESSLFYMQQRCISPEEGRKLLIRAFMADVIETIADEQKREELVNAIDSVI